MVATLRFADVTPQEVTVKGTQAGRTIANIVKAIPVLGSRTFRAVPWLANSFQANMPELTWFDVYDDLRHHQRMLSGPQVQKSEAAALGRYRSQVMAYPP
ncbi:hypothetical protein [Noviherbaspirillum pedocola]|uniref:Uncharacterized protein n=1 Tax=Noviherbaspirillum pedocola TaxID=2801341 RepID=A0A934SUW9_9BURK|nr:hypothetical protein [Noviherbaspirillum pedocola]MBK4737251.1 hypothetical protein [Noviherbaspirillum pedocola]